MSCFKEAKFESKFLVIEIGFSFSVLEGILWKLYLMVFYGLYSLFVGINKIRNIALRILPTIFYMLQYLFEYLLIALRFLNVFLLFLNFPLMKGLKDILVENSITFCIGKMVHLAFILSVKSAVYRGLIVDCVRDFHWVLCDKLK